VTGSRKTVFSRFASCDGRRGAGAGRVLGAKRRRCAAGESSGVRTALMSHLEEGGGRPIARPLREVAVEAADVIRDLAVAAPAQAWLYGRDAAARSGAAMPKWGTRAARWRECTTHRCVCARARERVQVRAGGCASASHLPCALPAMRDSSPYRIGPPVAAMRMGAPGDARREATTVPRPTSIKVANAMPARVAGDARRESRRSGAAFMSKTCGPSPRGNGGRGSCF